MSSQIDFFSDENLQKFNIIDYSYTEKAKPLSFNKYKSWIEKNYHGPLNWISNNYHREMREDIRNFYPEFKSALVFLFYYGDIKKFLDENLLKNRLSAFVLGYSGLDYHLEINNVLKAFEKQLKGCLDGLQTKLCVDTSPLMEKDLAYRAGLGFIGKNTLLIHPDFGSYCTIGTILLNQKLELKENEILENQCGDCSLCLSNCPTKALVDERILKVDQCISYYTIEEKKDISPPRGFEKDGYVFGCEVCQDICPFNQLPKKNLKSIDLPDAALRVYDFFNRDTLEIVYELERMSNREFKKKFVATSFSRLGRLGLLKNLKKLKLF